MLRIKVIQNGVARIYDTNSFNQRSALRNKSETYNFMYEMEEVEKGEKKTISFEDARTKAYVFVSPITCLIELETVDNK